MTAPGSPSLETLVRRILLPGGICTTRLDHPCRGRRPVAVRLNNGY